MTKEEMIKELKTQFLGEFDRQRQAKDMAIKYIEKLEAIISSLENECKAKNFVDRNDVIKRQADML